MAHAIVSTTKFRYIEILPGIAIGFTASNKRDKSLWSLTRNNRVCVFGSDTTIGIVYSQKCSYDYFYCCFLLRDWCITDLLAIYTSASVRTDHEFLYSIRQQKTIFNRKYVLRCMWLHNSWDTLCTQGPMILSQLTTPSEKSLIHWRLDTYIYQVCTLSKIVLTPPGWTSVETTVIQGCCRLWCQCWSMPTVMMILS